MPTIIKTIQSAVLATVGAIQFAANLAALLATIITANYRAFGATFLAADGSADVSAIDAAHPTTVHATNVSAFQ